MPYDDEGEAEFGNGHVGDARAAAAIMAEAGAGARVKFEIARGADLRLHLDSHLQTRFEHRSDLLVIRSLSPARAR